VISDRFHPSIGPHIRRRFHRTKVSHAHPETRSEAPTIRTVPLPAVAGHSTHPPVVVQPQGGGGDANA
jgi:hypothetical protein